MLLSKPLRSSCYSNSPPRRIIGDHQSMKPEPSGEKDQEDQVPETLSSLQHGLETLPTELLVMIGFETLDQHGRPELERMCLRSASLRAATTNLIPSHLNICSQQQLSQFLSQIRMNPVSTTNPSEIEIPPFSKLQYINLHFFPHLELRRKINQAALLRYSQKRLPITESENCIVTLMDSTIARCDEDLRFLSANINNGKCAKESETNHSSHLVRQKRWSSKNIDWNLEKTLGPALGGRSELGWVVDLFKPTTINIYRQWADLQVGLSYHDEKSDKTMGSKTGGRGGSLYCSLHSKTFEIDMIMWSKPKVKQGKTGSTTMTDSSNTSGTTSSSGEATRGEDNHVENLNHFSECSHNDPSKACSSMLEEPDATDYYARPETQILCTLRDDLQYLDMLSGKMEFETDDETEKRLVPIVLYGMSYDKAQEMVEDVRRDPRHPSCKQNVELNTSSVRWTPKATQIFWTENCSKKESNWRMIPTAE